MSPPRPGDLIGDRYEVRRLLGTGGMAQVWLGHDRVLDRPVAIKILSERYAADPAFVERFRREASAAAGLNHPNIVAVYDRGEADGSYYIVMEHLEGPDLKQVLRDSGPLPQGQAIDLAQQILGALGAAHRRDIVHRDVKPQNVLLSKGGLLKVTDFGIARAGAESDMTVAGSVIGTAQYLSPEQARGDDVTAASDCYSVGIVLYEMLTGQVPFDGDKPVAVAMRQISDPPADPRSLRGDLSPELAAVVMKALAKRPSDRYRTADEFARALEEARPAGGGGGEQPTQVLTARTQPTRIQRRPAAPPPPPPRRSAAGVVVVLSLLAVILLGLGLFLLGDGLGGGGDRVTVPDVVGETQAVAERAIMNAGLEVESVPESDSDAPAGQVLRTQPAVGTEVSEGRRITLVVSSGRPEVEVPDVTNRSLEDAEAELLRRGFTVDLERENNPAEPDTVFDQRPAGGASAPEASEVVLFVSEGRAEVTVPGVVGAPRAEAEDRLLDEGLNPVVTEQPTADAEPGTVLAQDPDPGDPAERGSDVALTVAVEPQFLPIPEVVGLSRKEAQLVLSDFDARVVGAREDIQPVGRVAEVNPPAGAEAEVGSRVELILSRGPGGPPPDPEDEPPPIDPGDDQ